MRLRDDHKITHYGVIVGYWKGQRGGLYSADFDGFDMAGTCFFSMFESKKELLESLRNHVKNSPDLRYY